MNTPVAITISAAKLAHLQHDVHVGHYIANALREAGAPVVGFVWPRFTSGTLISSVDPVSHDHTYTWMP